MQQLHLEPSVLHVPKGYVVRPKLATAIVAVMTLVALGGCSGSSAAPSQADGEFVRNMAMSVSSTMALADQARTRSDDPKIKALADDVFTSAAPFADELAALGVALAADGAPGFAHTDSEDHSTDSEMRSDTLLRAPTRQFNGTFVRLLRAEMGDGLKFAQQAQGSVTDPRTKAAADKVVSTWTTLSSRLETDT